MLNTLPSASDSSTTSTLSPSSSSRIGDNGTPWCIFRNPCSIDATRAEMGVCSTSNRLRGWRSGVGVRNSMRSTDVDAGASGGGLGCPSEVERELGSGISAGE